MNARAGLIAGLLVLVAWTMMAALAPAVAPYDPFETVSGARQAPSSEFWFGTDRLGRDVLSRVIFGARISLVLGFISVGIGAVVGTTLGIASGYYRGRIDTLIMRAMDAMLAFPGMLMALVIIAALGPSITNVMIAVGVSTIPRYARLIRSTVLSLREQAYIDAARLLWVARLEDHVPARASQHDGASSRALDPSVRKRHRGRGGAQLSRPWRATAHRRVGLDGRGRARGFGTSLVDLDLPRPRDFHRRHGLQPSRGQPSRKFGSAFEPTVIPCRS